MIINDWIDYKTSCRRTLTIECDDNDVDIDLLISNNKGDEKFTPLNLSKIEAKKLMFALMKLFPKQ